MMNAITIRNKIKKETTENLIKQLIKEQIDKEAALLIDNARKEVAANIRKTTVAEALCVLHDQGRSEEEIKGFYEDMVRLDHRKMLYNKTVSNYDALNFIKARYGIDFDRLDTDFAIREEEEGENNGNR